MSLSKPPKAAGLPNTSGGFWSRLRNRTSTSANDALTMDSLAGWDEAFAHFVNREPQIALLKSAIISAIETGFADRSHILCEGPPGCGKTEILRTLERLIGPHRCHYFDATTLTKAGGEEFLLNAEAVPSIIILDELDKAPVGTGTAWLQVMDDRAEIKKTDARNGSRRRKTDTLVVAAVNDSVQLSKRLGDALASRLAQRIFFPPPTPQNVEAILHAAAEQSRIDPACVPRVLQYARDEQIPTCNLRRLLALLRIGRDQWLAGDIASYLKAINEQERQYRSQK